MKLKLIIALLLLISTKNATAADTYVSGKIYDFTSTEQGLLIRIEGNQVPSSCPNPHSWGWMLIPQESTTMISVALMMLAQDKTNATIYTSGTIGSFCKVIQLDPH